MFPKATQSHHSATIPDKEHNLKTQETIKNRRKKNKTKKIPTKP